MAALCEGVITPNTTITDQVVFDKYASEGYAPQCWIAGKGSHGTINVTGAIEVSCNYFFFTIGDFLQIDRLNRYTRMFGLGEPTGIELSESTGTLTTDEFKMQLYGEPLYLGDTLQAAIGQGFHQFTPLQLANYVATMANGGTHYAASILKSVRSYGFSESLYERDNPGA
jgi:penicillin-binding protein 2